MTGLIETAAEALCTTDASYWHHEQTDDFPCTWCRTRASAFGDALAQHRDDFVRKVLTADIDWEGRDTSSWDRAQSVVDVLLAYFTGEAS